MSRLTNFRAKPADHIFLQSAAQRSTYRVPIKPASHFSGGRVRWISLRMSITRIHAPLLQYVCQSFLDIVFAPYVHYIRVRDRPRWSPSATSAPALTHYAKIPGVHHRKLQTFEAKQETQRVKDRETMFTTASSTNPFTPEERIPGRPPKVAA